MSPFVLAAAAFLSGPFCPPGCLDPNGSPRICWDAVPDTDLVGYVVRNQWGDEQMTAGVETCMSLAGSAVLLPDEPAELTVRAVDSAGQRSVEPSNGVPVQPWACLRSVNCRYVDTRTGPQWRCDGCEEPCYPWAHKRTRWPQCE